MIGDHIIDGARSTCLCSETGHCGLLACVVVASNGTEHFALIDAHPAAAGHVDATCTSVGHEQVGPLPPDVQLRVHQVLRPRCRWCAVWLQQPDSVQTGLCGECRL